MIEKIFSLKEVIEKYGFPANVLIPKYGNKEFRIVGEHYTCCGYFLRSADNKIIEESRFTDCYYIGK